MSSRWLLLTSLLVAGCPQGSTTNGGEETTGSLGPSGGRIELAGGEVVLTAPAGAVNTEVVVSAEKLPGTSAGVVGSVYELGPENITFNVPVTLAFRYRTADLGGAAPQDLFIAFVDGSVWQPMPTVLDAQTLTVTTSTTHLSLWGVLRPPEECTPRCLSDQLCDTVRDACVGNACAHVTCPSKVTCRYRVSGVTNEHFMSCRANSNTFVESGAHCSSGLVSPSYSDQVCKASAPSMSCQFPSGSITCPSLWLNIPADVYDVGCCGVQQGTPFCGIPGSLNQCTNLTGASNWQAAP